MAKLSEQDFWKLDRTFNTLFIVVSLVITPIVSIYVFQEQPHPVSKVLVLYFLVPMMSLILLWWWATFFDKLSLRIVCWYGLFNLVVHALWIITSIYVYVVYGEAVHQSISFYAGMGWVLCAYLVPTLPIVFVYRRYSTIQEPSPGKAFAGIFIYVVITLGLAGLAISGL